MSQCCERPVARATCPYCHLYIQQSDRCAKCLLVDHFLSTHGEVGIESVLPVFRREIDGYITQLEQLKQGKDGSMVEPAFPELHKVCVNWFAKRVESLKKSRWSISRIIETRMTRAIVSLGKERHALQGLLKSISAVRVNSSIEPPPLMVKTGMIYLVRNLGYEAAVLRLQVKGSKAERKLYKNINPVQLSYRLGMRKLSAILMDSQRRQEERVSGLISSKKIDTFVCTSFMAIYDKIYLAVRAGVIGSTLSTLLSQSYIQNDAIYQLASESCVWPYQAISTVVREVYAEGTATIANLVVLEQAYIGPLSVLKNLRVRNLEVRNAASLERVYVEGGCMIDGSLLLDVGAAVFGRTYSHSEFHNLTALQYCIFEGIRERDVYDKECDIFSMTTHPVPMNTSKSATILVKDVRYARNCMFAGYTCIEGQGIYQNCYFADLEIGERFTGSLISCYIAHGTCLAPPGSLTFYNCTGSGYDCLLQDRRIKNDSLLFDSSNYDNNNYTAFIFTADDKLGSISTSWNCTACPSKVLGEETADKVDSDSILG